MISSLSALQPSGCSHRISTRGLNFPLESIQHRSAVHFPLNAPGTASMRARFSFNFLCQSAENCLHARELPVRAPISILAVARTDFSSRCSPLVGFCSVGCHSSALISFAGSILQRRSCSAAASRPVQAGHTSQLPALSALVAAHVSRFLRVCLVLCSSCGSIDRSVFRYCT
jgi:hypothetical protein